MVASFYPYLFAALAVSGYALLSPMAKKVGTDLPPFSFIAVSTFIVFVITGIAAFIYERQKVIAAADSINWSWLVILSLTNICAYVAYLWAINRIPVVHYEMLIFISPVVGGAFAFLLLNEPFHARYLLALVFMVAGLAIVIKPWS